MSHHHSSMRRSSAKEMWDEREKIYNDAKGRVEVDFLLWREEGGEHFYELK